MWRTGVTDDLDTVATLDLTGLPPTWEEVSAFEKVQKAVKKGARELERPRAELAATAG